MYVDKGFQTSFIRCYLKIGTGSGLTTYFGLRLGSCFILQAVDSVVPVCSFRIRAFTKIQKIQACWPSPIPRPIQAGAFLSFVEKARFWAKTTP
jgi:hypothetical protein